MTRVSARGRTGRPKPLVIAAGTAPGAQVAVAYIIGSTHARHGRTEGGDLLMYPEKRSRPANRAAESNSAADLKLEPTLTPVPVTVRYVVGGWESRGLRDLYLTAGVHLVLVVDADSTTYVEPDLAAEQLRKAASVQIECTDAAVGQRWAAIIAQVLTTPESEPEPPRYSLWGGFWGQEVCDA